MTPRTRPWWHTVVSRADDPEARADDSDRANGAEPTAPTDRAGGEDDGASAPLATDTGALARAAGAVGVREPWADRPFVVAALTTAQEAVLAGLDDQPDGPRLDGVAPELGTLAARDDPTVSFPVAEPSDLDGLAGDGGSGADRAPVAFGEAAGPADELGDDQPVVPRLRPGAGSGDVPGVGPGPAPGTGPGNGTGSAPGDPEAGDPQTRTRWTEQEQHEG